MNIWLTHTCYSFLQGASTPQEIFTTAEKNGWEGVGIADFDGVYGIVKAHKAYQNSRKILNHQPIDNKIKNIFFGAELLLDPYIPGENQTTNYFKNLFRANSKSKDLDQNSSVFLQSRIAYFAINKSSYRELCTLISYVHQQGKKPLPLSPWDTQAPWPKKCIAILPARGFTQIFHPTQTHKNNSLFAYWEAWLKQLAKKFERNEDFFLALTPPTSPLEKNALLNHLTAHKNLGIPLIATEDAFFHEPQRLTLHNALTAIRNNTTINKCSWACFPNAERHIRHAKILENFCQQNGIFIKAMQNNKNLAKRFSFSLNDLDYQYPSHFIPHGHTPISFLKTLVAEKLFAKFGNHVPLKLSSLVEKELNLIDELKFADYFLTVWDIVKFAKEQNIFCQGRGSSANSAVCFLLEITNVDPLVSDVLFERFISKERGEPPDIDVDFEHERREEIIQYIYQKYGRQNAAMVANVVTFQTKGSIRAIGKALGVCDHAISQVTAALNDRIAYQKPYLEVITEGTQAANVTLSEETKLQWAELAQCLKNFPRHLGIHSGGFVISQTTLENICAIEPASMLGRNVVQWNKDDIENLGLFKIDILALGMLTCIRKTMELLKQHNKLIPGTRMELAWSNIPPECPKTYEMIQQARTYGVFQIESRAQMSMLPKVLPSSFYDLVIQIGIVRPGPISAGMASTFVRRKTGQDKVTYPDGRVQNILERTLGVPIFQEQVMKIAMVLGNFTAGEADELRRSMGAWKFTGDLHRFEEKLRLGMKQNGIPEDFAQKIYSHIQGFAQYGFPESHATSFAQIAYVSCYLKAHFPQYFLAALLNSQPLGFYSCHTLIQQARREGVETLPPCILNSHWDSFVSKDGRVRIGLRQIRGLRKETVEKFLTLRATKTIKSQKDAIIINLQEIELICQVFEAPEKASLALAGCFDCYDKNKRNMLWRLLAQPSALRNDIENTHFKTPDVVKEMWEDMIDDFDEMAFSLGPHPLEIIKKHYWPFHLPLAKFCDSSKIDKVCHGKTVYVVGLLVVRQSPPTAKGVTFLSLEDERGMLNLVLKPETYLKNRDKILQNTLIAAKGIKQKNGNSSTIIVQEIF